jgi:hypothetical protein
MGETLNILFQTCEDSSFEVQIQESWSGHTVHGKFIPPYTPRQLQALHKKLGALTTSHEDLREIGCRLFTSLGGSGAKKTPGEHSVDGVA